MSRLETSLAWTNYAPSRPVVRIAPDRSVRAWFAGGAEARTIPMSRSSSPAGGAVAAMRGLLPFHVALLSQPDLS